MLFLCPGPGSVSLGETCGYVLAADTDDACRESSPPRCRRCEQVARLLTTKTLRSDLIEKAEALTGCSKAFRKVLARRVYPFRERCRTIPDRMLDAMLDGWQRGAER